MALVIVRECSNGLQTLHRDCLFTSNPVLKGLPVEEVKDLCLLLNYLEEAFADSFYLRFGFILTCLKYKRSELGDIFFGHLFLFTTFAERHFFATGENSCVALIDSSLKCFVTKALCIVLQILKHLRVVCINAFQVLNRDVFK